VLDLGAVLDDVPLGRNASFETPADILMTDPEQPQEEEGPSAITTAIATFGSDGMQSTIHQDGSMIGGNTTSEN